jgi:hypothetical protein
VSFLSVFADNSTAVLAVCIPGFLASAGYAVWRLQSSAVSAPARPSAPPPAARRVATPQPMAKPKSLDLGVHEHQVRGEAKTIKVPQRDERQVDTARVPVVSANDDAARDELFAGIGSTKPGLAAPKPESGNLGKDPVAVRKVERMEELGFHHQAKNLPTTPVLSDNTKTEVIKVLPPGPVADAKRSETTTDDKPADLASKPAAARTQTQELDDILSRIDKVLADNPVMATTTLGSASNETEQHAKPVPPALAEKLAAEKRAAEKADKPAGEGQQKLF